MKVGVTSEMLNSFLRSKWLWYDFQKSICNCTATKAICRITSITANSTFSTCWQSRRSFDSQLALELDGRWFWFGSSSIEDHCSTSSTTFCPVFSFHPWPFWASWCLRKQVRGIFRSSLETYIFLLVEATLILPRQDSFVGKIRGWFQERRSTW